MAENDTTLLKVVAGSRLMNVSKYMTEQGIVVPHGECPLVAVGGHTQSGGYGHTLRFMVVLTDYVKSFRIVLADCSYISVYRPNMDPPARLSKVSDNDDIFFSVLGGGLGSFGVVVEYSYECVKDDDHPHSTGHSSTTKYSKKRFEPLFDTIQQYMMDCEKGDLDDDIDMMCTAISFDMDQLSVLEDWLPGSGTPQGRPTNNTADASSAGSSVTTSGTSIVDEEDDGRGFGIFLKGFIAVELLYGNRSGQPDTTSPSVADCFEKVYKNMLGNWLLAPTYVDFYATEHHGLLNMCDTWVRNYLIDGREFAYPYLKRFNATFQPLTKPFKDGFMQLVHDAISDNRVRVVFQIGLGGSQRRDHVNRKYTAVQRRDLMIGIGFDIFYTEGHKELAEGYQAKMKELLEETVKEKDTVKMIWASFGNTNIEEVWRKYYDSPEMYDRLRRIKYNLDPTTCSALSSRSRRPRAIGAPRLRKTAY